MITFNSRANHDRIHRLSEQLIVVRDPSQRRLLRDELLAELETLRQQRLEQSAFSGRHTHVTAAGN